MITIISNDAYWIAPWWKSCRCFKYLIFNEGVITKINIVVGRADVSVIFNKM